MIRFVHRAFMTFMIFAVFAPLTLCLYTARAAEPIYLPIVTKPPAPTPAATRTPTPTPTTTPTPTATPPPIWDCSANLYNCHDFSTQADAPAVYEYCLALVGFDVHRLDGDNDGVACEALP